MCVCVCVWSKRVKVYSFPLLISFLPTNLFVILSFANEKTITNLWRMRSIRFLSSLALRSSLRYQQPVSFGFKLNNIIGNTHNIRLFSRLECFRSALFEYSSPAHLGRWADGWQQNQVYFDPWWWCRTRVGLICEGSFQGHWCSDSIWRIVS